MDNLNITIEFGGGAELLFNNKKSYDINLPGSAWNIGALLHWMTGNLLKERPELFIQNKSVRPGILVLVNDADWELLVMISLILSTTINL